MAKPTVWQPSESVVAEFWALAKAVWKEQLAAVPDGVPTIPSFEKSGTNRKASLTFYYQKSSTTAYFTFANDKWSCVNYPND